MSESKRTAVEILEYLQKASEEIHQARIELKDLLRESVPDGFDPILAFLIVGGMDPHEDRIAAMYEWFSDIEERLTEGVPVMIRKTERQPLGKGGPGTIMPTTAVTEWSVARLQASKFVIDLSGERATLELPTEKWFKSWKDLYRDAPTPWTQYWTSQNRSHASMLGERSWGIAIGLDEIAKLYREEALVAKPGGRKAWRALAREIGMEAEFVVMMGLVETA